jgi:hypothetical protein
MLLYFDILSPDLTLHFKQFHKHPSLFSGFLSIIIIFLCIFSAIYFSLDIINHLNPETYFYYHQEKDVGHFPLNESSIFHFIDFKGIPKNENPSSLFQIFGFLDTFITTYNSVIQNRSLLNHYTYGPCLNNSKKYKLNDINNALLDSSFSKMGYCINGFYNATTKEYISINNENFIHPIISHGTSHTNHTSYSIIIQRCQNDSFYKFNSCQTNEYIDNIINNNEISALIAFLNQEADIMNYTNPIKHYINSIEFSFSVGTFSVGNLNFQPLRINTHNGFFFDNLIIDNSYYYEQNDIKNYNTNINIYTSFHFLMHNKIQIFERKYKRIQNIFADIGGMIKAITTLGTILNYFAMKYQTFINIESIIYSKIAGMKNNKTFNKNNKNQSFNKKIVNNENFSIKIDNYLNKDLKTQNSQNFSITNSMLSPIMNSNLKINKNFYEERNSNSYIFIKENKEIRNQLGIFTLIYYTLCRSKYITSKKENYVDIIKWYYYNVISEKCMFDLYFYCAKIEKTEQKFIYYSNLKKHFSFFNSSNNNK